MTWSKITRILNAQTIVTPGANVIDTDIVRTQRDTDERGVLFSCFDGAPGAGGTLAYWAALSDESPMAPVSDTAATAITLNMANHSALVFGALLTNLFILPRVQFRSTDTTVTTQRQLSIWLME